MNSESRKTESFHFSREAFVDVERDDRDDKFFFPATHKVALTERSNKKRSAGVSFLIGRGVESIYIFYAFRSVMTVALRTPQFNDGDDDYDYKRLPSVIAICGQKRAGKNTAASALREAFPEAYNAEMAFAEPIKRCVSELFGLTDDQVDGGAKETPDPRWEMVTPRRLLQFFGTEMMQFKLQELLPATGRCFWSRCLVERVRAHLEMKNSIDNRERIHNDNNDNNGDRGQIRGGVIITDMRFLHEYTALKEAFGEALLSIRIVRYGINTPMINASSSSSSSPSAAAVADSHSSEVEQAAIPVDLEIENGDTVKEHEFRKKCVNAVRNKYTRTTAQ